MISHDHMSCTCLQQIFYSSFHSDTSLNSQAAIQRIQKSGVNASQNHVLAIEKLTAKIKVKYQVNIHLNWVSEHMNIKGNELADQAAKKRTELQKNKHKEICLFFFY